MIALREVQAVTSRSLTIQLPDDFLAKTVEIIVLPIDADSDLLNMTADLEPAVVELQKLLLAAPIISDEEAENFAQVKEWASEWRAEEF